MQIDFKDKRTMVTVLLVLVLFYAIITTINLFSQVIMWLSYVAKLDADFGIEQIIILIAFLVSIIGLAIFAAALLSKKISDRTLITVQVLVVLALLALFVISIIDEGVYHNITMINQAVNFAILIGIYCYQFRNKKPQLDNNLKTTNSKE